MPQGEVPPVHNEARNTRLQRMPTSSPSNSSPTSSPPNSSPTCSSSPLTDITINESPVPDIPIEIVTEEEMAFIEAALSVAAATASAASSLLASRSWASLSSFRRQASSVHLVPTTPPQDIEAYAGPESSRSRFGKFRSRRGLTVSDLTSTEWCEKQKEFSLVHGKPRRTEAMKAGSNRHLQLEKEAFDRLPIQIHSTEDTWAVQFLNFTAGIDQLHSEGSTRELPVIGFVEGIWLKGIIDEIRMPKAVEPILVETKTRQKATLPSEAQKRNARFQLMCYKYLWDNLAASFPKEHFFGYYGLDPNKILSSDVQKYIALQGFQGKTLEDVVTFYSNTCSNLPASQEKLLLRYESQSDHSLLEECHFEHDPDWSHNEINKCIQFLSGEREAAFVSQAEIWKCRFCSFVGMCPMSSLVNQRAA